MPGMKRLATLLAFLCLVALTARPATAQVMLRDAETETLLNEASRGLISAAGLSPNNVRIVLIQDPSINAFVAGGQVVYLHTGLIDKAGNLNEVQGVIAHELGHIVGGHAVFQRDGGYGGISLLSLALGLAAAAAGSPDAGMAIMMAGQRAAIGKYLSFSRSQESSADAAGVRFLNTAGISGRGMLEFFKRLQNLQFSYGFYSTNPEVDPFGQTHPMSGERLATLTQDLQKQPSWNTPTDPALEVRFKRVQAKLRGYVNEPEQTLKLYPPSDQSVYAHYARAYAYHRKGFPDQARSETEALVAAHPADPYFLELEGQIMLESGDPRGALVPLRKATESTNFQPLIASTFGHALVATDDPAHLPEAERVLRQAVARDRENPYAWYQLGMVYERKGDEARVALATAERANLIGDVGVALISSRRAMGGLPQGSPDWIRAQDIMMVSQTAVEDQRNNRRNRMSLTPR
ncbi:M48 family metalloprotease [Sphingomonas sp. G-3-2-10]|uniref:M48 family metalloprotease n=1 Tax=Sphingomonas sp. G-3-2-10 TaxID=2728838 RepID=UPI00146D2E6C|nr:M48 family metalloprotease [Sphingomonas sp. G-3-2-10]NML07640.1 M48 family metalloprotease [Sphingomonas sp. G-3-2-10]